MPLTYGHSSLPSGVMRPSDSGTCTVGEGAEASALAYMCSGARVGTLQHAQHMCTVTCSRAHCAACCLRSSLASTERSPAGGGRHRRSSGTRLAGRARSHCIAGSWQRGGWACQAAGTVQRAQQAQRQADRVYVVGITWCGPAERAEPARPGREVGQGTARLTWAGPAA